MRRLLVIAAVLALAACGGDDGGSDEPERQDATPEPSELRVQTLMDAADCVGEPIGTQLYSYETGRCSIGGDDEQDLNEVTVAVFETNDLRDQWLGFGEDFGGNPIRGDRWAAVAGSIETADAFAAANDGERL